MITVRRYPVKGQVMVTEGGYPAKKSRSLRKVNLSKLFKT